VAHYRPGRSQDAAHARAHGAARSAPARLERMSWHGSRRLAGGQTSARCTPQASLAIVHSPDTVESPSSKRGRQATEGRNSPAWSTAPDCSGGQGKSTTPRKAALRWVGARGPAKEERGRLVRSGDGELVVEIGAEAVSSLPAGGEASGTDKMHWEGPFYSYVGEWWMGWMGWLSLGS
jgi:hypothetical protein